MSPILYMLKESPPVRAVLMVLKFLNVDNHIDLKKVDLFTSEHMRPEFLKINPLHTVPTLVMEDGFTLWDSHAITKYLLQKFGTPAEENHLEHWAKIDQYLHFDTGTLCPLILRSMNPIILSGKTVVDEDAVVKILEAYDFLESFLRLSDTRFLVGDAVTLADFSVIASVTSLEILVPISPEDKFVLLTAWMGRVKLLDAYEANREGVESLRDILHASINK